ncbi:MAG: AMP-binding protein [Dehalococcoidales bacterium]|nr:AMP-binding protein [Dehalococcoidales bacterium]
MAVNNGDYFDELETIAPETRQKYLNDKLAATVEHAYNNAPAVKKLLDSCGVSPGEIQTVSDLEKLPIKRKTDLIEMQKSDLPYGGILTIPPENVERVFISPGPVYEIQSPDIKWFSKSFWAAGFRKGDIVINTFTYHMSPAGILFHEGIRDCGATVVVAGTGNTDLQVQIMKDLKVTGFVGTPSFLMTVINTAEEQGYSFSNDFAVKKSWFTGEPLSPTIRQILENDYGISTSQAYAVTEPGGAIAYECEEKSGMHFMDDYIIEIVDPETGNQLGPGEIGEIVVTPIHSPDWGLIRFGTGDLSSYITGPCPCGRTSNRITGIVGRTTDAVKVRGMFIVARQAEQVVKGFDQVSRFQFTVGRKSQRDELILNLALTNDIQDKESLQDEISSRFQSTCRIKIDGFHFVDNNAIPEDAKTIIDERKWE